MSDDDELTELRETVQSLRERVSELERRVDSDGGPDADSDRYDRYDRYVLDTLEDVTHIHPRTVMRTYAEAGVHDTKKQKRRTKRLKRLEGGE